MRDRNVITVETEVEVEREKGDLRAEGKYGANDDLFSAVGLSHVGVTTNVYSDHIWNDGKTLLCLWLQLSQLPTANFIS